MKILLLSAAFLVSALALFSCNKDNPIPPEDQPQINLTLEDTSCTEAWIKLTTANISLPAEVALKQDDSSIQNITLISSDTLLYVDSLLPNHSYKFQSVIQSINQTSSLVNVTTMDTTSQDFTWQAWTFGGEVGSCNLYDVAIIDENDIWAVGRISVRDSLGLVQSYNVIKWNGSSWQLLKLTYDNNIMVIPRGILSLGPDDFYLAAGSIFHWDGISSTAQLVFSRNSLPNAEGTIEKILGEADKLYGMGNSGSIAHYQNGHWSSEESGTEMALADIAGTSDGDIFICGADASHIKGLILKKSTSGWETIINSRYLTPAEIFKPDLYGSLPSIWLDEKNTLYAAGNLLYQYKFGKWDYVNSLPENFILGDPGLYYRGYIADVKGVKSNDMWIVGDRNTLRHFNGVSWKQVGYPYSPDSDIGWETIYPTENCTVAVGYEGNSAIVMLIKK